MRTAITLARRHDEQTLSVVTGPEVSIDQQIRDFKQLVGAGRENGDVAQLEVWSSSNGRIKHFLFRQPAPGTPASEETASEETEAASDTADADPNIAKPTPAPRSIFRRRKAAKPQTSPAKS